MLYLFSTKHVNTQIYFCDQKKAIATCSARLAAGNFAGAAKTSSFFDHRFCSLWLFSRVWYACSEKDLGYSLQMSARRIVQSDFSILPCEASETVIVVRPRTTKTLL